MVSYFPQYLLSCTVQEQNNIHTKATVSDLPFFCFLRDVVIQTYSGVKIF